MTKINPFVFMNYNYYEELERDPLSTMRSCKSHCRQVYLSSHRCKYRLLGVTAGFVGKLRADPKLWEAFCDDPFWQLKANTLRLQYAEIHAVHYLMGMPRPLQGAEGERVRRHAQALRILLAEGRTAPEIERELATRGGVGRVIAGAAAASASGEGGQKDDHEVIEDDDPYRVTAPTNPPAKPRSGAGRKSKSDIFDPERDLAVAFGRFKRKFFALEVGGRLSIQIKREGDEGDTARFSVIKVEH